MGYSISWLAVREKDADSLLQRLGLAPTSEMTMFGKSLFTGRTLPGGWLVLVINRCDHKFVKPGSLTSVSQQCEVIACSTEEHVMCSTADLWRNGERVWRIEHDAQKSITHIKTSGLLPDGYASVEKEFAERQKESGGEKSDTDYFIEIPLQVARNIVGFKHDEAESQDSNFRVFKEAKPWWKVW